MKEGGKDRIRLITGIFFLAAVAVVVVVDGSETAMTVALVLAALFTIRSIVVVFIGRKLLVVASIRLTRNCSRPKGSLKPPLSR